MDDAPIRILLLRDADNCALNQGLKDARSKTTIKELEREYETWFNYLGTQMISFKGASKENSPRPRWISSIQRLIKLHS